MLPQRGHEAFAAEAKFRVLLENWYVKAGVAPQDPLFSFWVDANGAKTWNAGERIARELSTFGDIEGLRVLDVGSGFGACLIAVARAHATSIGVELDPALLGLSRARAALHGVEPGLVRGDAFRLPFADRSFDAVVCTEVLEHVPKRAALISEMARVLKDKAVLYLSFPNFLSLRNVLSDPHYQLFGVTLLPPRWADVVTRAIRRRPYDVESLPVAPWIARLCRDHDIQVYSLNKSEQLLLARLAAPETIKRGPMAAVVRAFSLLGLAGILRALVRMWAAVGPSAVLAGRKGSTTP